jgi:hypothetical protein
MALTNSFLVCFLVNVAITHVFFDLRNGGFAEEQNKITDFTKDIKHESAWINYEIIRWNIFQFLKITPSGLFQFRINLRNYESL